MWEASRHQLATGRLLRGLAPTVLYLPCINGRVSLYLPAHLATVAHVTNAACLQPPSTAHLECTPPSDSRPSRCSVPDCACDSICFQPSSLNTSPAARD
jgi:hypothetical protein